MVIRRNVLIAAFAVTALALLAMFALSRPGVSEATTEGASEANLARDFAVLRRAPKAGDELPPAVRRMFQPTAQREGLDLDAARAAAPGGRGYVWVLPGDRSVCLAIPDPVDGFGINCRDPEGAAAGELWVGLVGGRGQRAGDTRVAVLVPDDTDTVTAVSSSGRRTPLQASGNVVFADLSDSHHLDLEGGSGARSLSVPGTPEALVAEG